MISKRNHRRLIALLMLTSVSMAGLFGPALHSLAHLGGHSESGASSCGCDDCPFARAAKENADDQPLTNMGEKHDCAICRFLALSKQVEEHDVQPVLVAGVTEPVCIPYHFQPLPVFTLSTAPRGPPFCV